MTNIPRGRKVPANLKSMGDHDEFLNRITKSLYYSKLPMTDCLSFPVTELAAEIFTEVKNGQTLERLDVEEASRISRNACVSPCSLVLALLYLERLKDCNPEYLHRVAPSELFLVSLMVASKFLHDDGEEDEVFNTEWAQSGDLTVSQINQLEKDFLKAIDWAVFVRDQDFWEKLKRIEKDIAYKEARKRGWFSYTELCCLMNSMHFMAIAHILVNVSSICLATYAVGFVTLLGSGLVASYLPGTQLTPRQPTISNNVSNVELSAIIESKPLSINVVCSDVISATFVDNTLKCNKTSENCPDRDSPSTVPDVSWKWWLNSMMTWLPEYSGIEPTSSLPIKDTNLGHGIFIPNTKHFFNTAPVLQDVDDSVIEIDWKEVLGLDVNFPLDDWKYYANYMTKVTLGHRH